MLRDTRNGGGKRSGDANRCVVWPDRRRQPPATRWSSTRNRADRELGLLVVTDRRRIADDVVPALAAHPRLRVLAIVRDARDAARVARTTPPDLVIVDATSPDAAEALRFTRSGARATPMLVIGRPRTGRNVPAGTAFIADTEPLDALAESFVAVASLASAMTAASTPRR